MCKKEFSTEVLEVLEEANKCFVELIFKNIYIYIWIRLEETNVVSKTRRNRLREDGRIEEKQNVKYINTRIKPLQMKQVWSWREVSRNQPNSMSMR